VGPWLQAGRCDPLLKVADFPTTSTEDCPSRTSGAILGFSVQTEAKESSANPPREEEQSSGAIRRQSSKSTSVNPGQTHSSLHRRRASPQRRSIMFYLRSPGPWVRLRLATSCMRRLAHLRQTSPVLERPGDLAALADHRRRAMSFSWRIHRLSPIVEEVLYPAREDYQLDIMIGEGPGDHAPSLLSALLHPGGSNAEPGF